MRTLCPWQVSCHQLPRPQHWTPGHPTPSKIQGHLIAGKPQGHFRDRTTEQKGTDGLVRMKRRRGEFGQPIIRKTRETRKIKMHHCLVCQVIMRWGRSIDTQCSDSLVKVMGKEIERNEKNSSDKERRNTKKKIIPVVSDSSESSPSPEDPSSPADSPHSSSLSSRMRSFQQSSLRQHDVENIKDKLNNSLSKHR